MFVPAVGGLSEVPFSITSSEIMIQYMRRQDTCHYLRRLFRIRWKMNHFPNQYIIQGEEIANVYLLQAVKENNFMLLIVL